MQIKIAPTPAVFAPQITAYVVPQKKTYKTPAAASESKRAEEKSYFAPVKADYSINGATDNEKIYAQQQQPGVFNSAEEAFTEIKPVKAAAASSTLNGKGNKKSDSSTPKLADPLYSDSDEVVQAPSEYYDYVSEWTTPNPPQNVSLFLCLSSLSILPIFVFAVEALSLKQAICLFWNPIAQ